MTATTPQQRVVEADVLERHTKTLSERYPESIWPATSVAPGERAAPAAQAAFVAGIRFACDQLRSEAAELREVLASGDGGTS